MLHSHLEDGYFSSQAVLAELERACQERRLQHPLDLLQDKEKTHRNSCGQFRSVLHQRGVCPSLGWRRQHYFQIEYETPEYNVGSFWVEPMILVFRVIFGFRVNLIGKVSAVGHCCSVQSSITKGLREQEMQRVQIWAGNWKHLHDSDEDSASWNDCLAFKVFAGLFWCIYIVSSWFPKMAVSPLYPFSMEI